jgi:hypothetical protein
MLNPQFHRFLSQCLVISLTFILIIACAPSADALNDLPAWQVMSEKEQIKQNQMNLGDSDQFLSQVDQSISSDQSILPLAIDLSGTWGLIHRVQSQAEIPVLKQIVTTTITAYLLLEITQSLAGEMQITQKTCDIEMYTNSNLGKTEIPKRFIEHLPSTQRTARFQIIDDQNLQFQILGKTELRGLSLDYPQDQPVPTEATNPLIIDQDEDGHPGMTVLLTGFPVGEAYVVQRSWDELISNVYAIDDLKTQLRIEGEINWDDEQQVVDASDPILKTPSSKWIHPDAMRRRFAMERLSQATCENLRSIKAAYEIDLAEMPTMP